MNNVSNSFSMSQLRPGARIHMIGIGGISMSALAGMLIYWGYSVSGSDTKSSNLTEELAAKGAKIFTRQRAENIENPDLVCYTAAISETNPELAAAKALGVPIIERAELLGAIMKFYKYPIAIAGTHGKTTTTSMLSLVLLEANTDPTILVGGELTQIGGNYRIGSQDFLPFEACEYVESFLHFSPFLSIIANVEEDHLDYFSDIKHIISSFTKFASLTDPNGCIIVCSDNKNALTVVQNVNRKVLKYAIFDTEADYRAENIVYNTEGCAEFDILRRGERIVSVKLHVPGEHNVENSLAVCAAADFFGLGMDAVKAGLEAFDGTKRRFEHKGFLNGCEIVDDYAHHPTEIKATIEAAKKMNKNTLWVAFQPHTYSRTKAFLDKFAEALSLADRPLICDVYPAREDYDGTVHACDLAAKINGAVYINDMAAAARYLRENIKDGDMLITMGAGDIYKLGDMLTNPR